MPFNIYRLAFSDPQNFYEQLGDPVTTTGGAPVPALRSALRHSVSLLEIPYNPGEDTVVNRLKLRRQWRSLVNNTPMKLQGIPLVWDADPENSGWYMPDQGQLVDIEASVGLATGFFKVENFIWIVAGRPRTHRRAMWIYLKDLRTALWARDFRRLIYNADFAGLTPLALSYLPPGMFDPVTTGGTPGSPAALPVGADTGQSYVIPGLVDEARLSFEQVKTSMVRGTVVAYDRRGEQTSPTGGPGPGWEEFYGPDYPYSWTEGFAQDTPVLENGRCRVRFDSTGIMGFCVDVWNVNKWEEQGKFVIARLSGSNPFMNTLVSASLAEYSETRVVMQCVMRASSDNNSREEVCITLQRGWSGPRFEVYPAPAANGEKVDAYVQWATASGAAADPDDSAIKVDSGGAGGIEATAKGTGHTGAFAVANFGAGTFTGENWIAIGRWEASGAGAKPYGALLGVLGASLSPSTTNSQAYSGVFRNAVQLTGTGKVGYLSVQTGFPPQRSSQALEAENMTLATGTASAADAEASGAKATTATRTAEALHVSQVKWPDINTYAVFRIFARVKTSASTLKIRAKTPYTTGAIATTASTSYVWVDLGDIATGNATLEILAWAAAAATISVDRIEAFLVEDRTAAAGVSQGIYAGARDLGQSILYDSRVFPTLVSRTT